MAMNREDVEAERDMRMGSCGATNPGTGPLAPCTLPLGHPPVPGGDGTKWAHRNEFGDWWGDVLPEEWTGVTTAAQCPAVVDDGKRCAYLEGHPLIWVEGDSFEHSVPGLVSWNVETVKLCGAVRPRQSYCDTAPTYLCTLDKGHGPVELAEGLYAGHRNVADGVAWGSHPDDPTMPPPDAPLNALQRGLLAPLLTELAPPSPAGLRRRLRLFPLPYSVNAGEAVGLVSPFTIPPRFALVVDGFPNAAVRDAHRAMWEAEGERIGATAVWCLVGHVELHDIAGTQYGA